ncbi:MAG: hypothetical protein V7700_10075 [Halioglobus sp.]
MPISNHTPAMQQSCREQVHNKTPAASILISVTAAELLAQTGILEEVIVTATKRAQSLQN